MSGGHIEQQGQWDHQVLMFTFLGPLPAQLRSRWNRLVAELKQQYPGQIIGVTMKGRPTPQQFRARPGAGQGARRGPRRGAGRSGRRGSRRR